MVLLIQCLIFAGLFFYFRHRYSGADMEIKNPRKHPARLAKIAKNTYHKIGLKRTSKLSFVIVREAWHHRLLKHLGLATEVSLGNEAIDKKFYFICDDEDALAHALSSPKVQRTIEQLFLLDIQSIIATTDKIWCPLRWFKLTNVKDKEYGVAGEPPHWELLETFQAELTQAEQTIEVQQYYSLHKLAFFFSALHTTLFALAFVVFLPTLFSSIEIINNYDLVNVGAVIGVVIAIGWMMLLVRLFSGSAWIAWLSAEFLFMGLAGIMICTIALVRDANVMLDWNTPQEHVAPLLQKSCTLECSYGRRKHRRTKTFNFTPQQCQPGVRDQLRDSYHSNYYYCSRGATLEFHMFIEHWDASLDRNYYFKTKAENYDAWNTGQYLVLPRHPGLFGVEWVDPQEIKKMP